MSLPPARLVLVRHGESQWNAAGLMQGQTGPGLSQRGHAQARAAAETLVARWSAVDFVVRSDLVRVAETAAPLETLLGVRARLDAGLRERDIGAWAGKSRRQVAADDPDDEAAYRREDEAVTPGGGESLPAMRTRVTAAMVRAGEVVSSDAGRHRGDRQVPTAVVYCHAGPIRLAVAALLGLPDGGQRGIAPVANAGISVLEPPPDGGERAPPRLASYNTTDHLDQLAEPPARQPASVSR